MLCKLALTDAEARAWLLNSGGPSWLEALAETELLARVWHATTIDPAQPSTVSSFAATLDTPEQALLSVILSEDSPGCGIDDARAAFYHLKMQRVRSLIDQKQARLKATGLPPQEILTLTQEVSELLGELRDLKRCGATPPILPRFDSQSRFGVSPNQIRWRSRIGVPAERAGCTSVFPRGKSGCECPD